jgi:hypothetical protein
MNDPKILDMDDREWKGYVSAKLETLAELKACMGDLKKSFNGLQLKVAAAGGGAGLIVTILVLLLSKHL